MTRQIPDCENLKVEFKSDRDRLSDRDLVSAVICLANTEGGELYVGIEEDGAVTGLHPSHQNVTGVVALIANQTSPPLSIRVDVLEVGMLRVAKIHVPKSRHLVATSEILPGGEADVGTLETIIEEENRLRHSLPVDSLIALSLLRQERRVDTTRLAPCIQKDEASARQVIERLVESGLVEAHGVRKGRTYTLSPKVYKRMGQSADYVRQAGFDAIQQEQMVLQYVRAHGKIARKDAASLCRISSLQASYLLRKLSEEGKLRSTGQGRGTVYILP